MIIHYDYREGLDKWYVRNTDTYYPFSLNETTSEYNWEVEIISVFISSKVTARVIDNYPKLKCIICRSAGTDHVDVSYAQSKGIKVLNVSAYGPHVIATHAIALLLTGIRHMRESIDFWKRGDFSFQYLLPDLRIMKVGIVGTGKIGQEIIKLIHAFGSSIIAHDLYPQDALVSTFGVEYVSQDFLFSHSDIIILACNATEENKDMINTSTILQMKKGVYLINIARGHLINEQDLIAHHDHFAFIWLDTVKNESPEGVKDLVSCENIIITPHIAYLADSSVDMIWKKTYEHCENPQWT